MTREVLTIPLEQLRERTSVKWRHHGPDVLPLWVAEMDARPAPPVVEELERVARTGDLGYPVPGDYADAISRWYLAEAGVEVDPTRVRLTVDVLTGIRHALRAVSPDTAPVIITTPVYPPFFTLVEEMGRPLVTAPLGEDGRLDPAALAEAFATAGRGSALLLANPHNPTGTVPTAQELGEVLRLAEEHGVSVVSDEIHAPLVLSGADFVSVLAVPERSRAVAVMSAAKGWNLAALKAAAIVPGPAADEAVSRIPATTWMQASHIAAQGHIAAFDRGQEWQAALLRDLEANRRLLGELLEEHLPAVRWQPMEGTYLAWLDCRSLDLGENPAAHFLHEAKVALNPGHTFGSEGAGHARLNIATSPEILTEAIERMARSLPR
ncbi:pyridoxal phosphate-dependent aminotransferase [Marihabitans asiaticum]|uniref:cysteine-S-conjugate beta-lyase n=1 Tax=Marihabitans asiaticum TaxID=415218 RepID=A0A560W6M4_9MICO|nr:aminotransferase class I/II-fold pyridoxal phosphate-dependent enzyme [Marihabitans asiaticum]TWD13273.1 cystathionine beta-lyase [Marihabitans asiaticum]